MLQRLVQQERPQRLQGELAGVFPALVAAHSVRDEQTKAFIFRNFLIDILRFFPYEVHPDGGHVLVVVPNAADIRDAADYQFHRLFNSEFQSGYLKFLTLSEGVPFVFIQLHSVYGRAVGRTQIADLPLTILESDLSVMPGDKFTTSEFREYPSAPSEPAFFDIECHIFPLQGQQGIEYLVEINFFQWLRLNISRPTRWL